MKIDAYTASGTKKGQVVWPKAWSVKPNTALLAQAMHVYRNWTHGLGGKTKTRGEVELTKAKWYRQKGTGRARHGAKSAPIFVGGGKAHGPRGERRELALPKKMRQKAVRMALTAKVEDGKVVMVSGISAWKKTKEAEKLVRKVAGERKATVALSEKNLEQVRYLKNVKNVKVMAFRNLNALSVWRGGFLIVDEEALK